MKYLFLYPWIMTALLLGIGVCLGLGLHVLLSQPQQAAHVPNALLVMEEFVHALA